MEVATPVVPPTPTPDAAGSPFRDHDVREWQRVDTVTGALERARFETDRWTKDKGDDRQQYGKVVDSRLRTNPDTGLRQAASRQLEIFHSRTPTSRVQVVRTRTVATSSHRWTSNSTATSIEGTTITNGVHKWTSGSIGASTATAALESTASNTSAETVERLGGGFENLQLSVIPLDLSSQKQKASVGRSASRRPPTRQRSRAEQSQQQPINDHSIPLGHAHVTAAANLHRVSRLCHQIHETAVRQAFGRRSPRLNAAVTSEKPSTVEIVELESTSSDNTQTNSHTNLVRTKSSSSEDIHITPDKLSSTNKSIEDLDDLEQLQTWRRTSKIRRSLQFPQQNKPAASSTKPADLPEHTVSVKKIKEDLEKGRRLNTVLRNNSVNLEALDQILQSISGSGSDKNSDDVETDGETGRKQKRNSFVTVESIQEVKGRLRRTSSPISDIYKANGNKDDDPDDGIGGDEPSPPSNDRSPVPPMDTSTSRVKSYVYGMEALLNKKPGIGTGSLESKVKLMNGNSTAKNEDWYNRRKSYGFEQVHTQTESTNSILKTNKLVESSTDSGICRSSEIVLAPTSVRGNENGQDHRVNGWKEITTGQVKKLANTYNKDQQSEVWPKPSELKSTTITIPIVENNNVVDLPWHDEPPQREIKRHSIAVDESKYVKMQPSVEDKYRRTSLASNDQLSRDDEDTNMRRTKKVEFCKTEVHFAAESGKVNIVATDEKPPPTQNFRRRRRNSGPLIEDFNSNGLPVLHFGDSTYEKTMFGVTEPPDVRSSPPLQNSTVHEEKNDDTNLDRMNYNERVTTTQAFGVVTVNADNTIANEIAEVVDDDRKDLSESEIKGILKNKPIKPKPYHLGEPIPIVTYPPSDEETKWGVKLRHVEKPETPIWKSTVTVHNYYEKKTEEEQSPPEFQKLLKNLRPTKRLDYSSDTDTNRCSWSKEDGSGAEHKGYSTKINFGEGEATVVENDREGNTTWPRSESLSKDSKQLLNRGLVVRIGREDHSVRSKMTTTRGSDNTTTTTKITIDLSPSPPPEQEKMTAHQRSHFKSTSLILSTIKDSNQKTARKVHNGDSHFIRAPKRMSSDVKSTPRKTSSPHPTFRGSPNKDTSTSSLYDAHGKYSSPHEEHRNGLDAHRRLIPDAMSPCQSPSRSSEGQQGANTASRNSYSQRSSAVNNRISSQRERDILQAQIKTVHKTQEDITSRLTMNSNQGPFKEAEVMNISSNHQNHGEDRNPLETLRKLYEDANSDSDADKEVQQLMSRICGSEKDDSSSVVSGSWSKMRAFRNLWEARTRYESTSGVRKEKGSTEPIRTSTLTPSEPPTRLEARRSPLLRHSSPGPISKQHSSTQPARLDLKPVEKLSSPSLVGNTGEFKNAIDSNLATKHTVGNIVLRQPKKSEMTYFGVKVPPSPAKQTSKAVIRKETKLSEKPDLLQHHKKAASPPTCRYGRSRQKSSEPIYENVQNTPPGNKYGGREFDSAILEELTKAADQILQAVNGYTDEDSQNKFSTDEEHKKKLETIVESRSWKRSPTTPNKTKTPNTKAKLRHTSSTSSIDSITKKRTPEKIDRQCVQQKKKQEKSDSSTSSKANVKARRLQRASSREALLQSHGSSSEDLPNKTEVPLRKPRLVKKTKAMQLTMTNGLEFKKHTGSAASTPTKKKDETSRGEERILNSLPEIRHKTAVSTIRSTSDKLSKDRTKKPEEPRRRTPQKKETTRGSSSTTTTPTRSSQHYHHPHSAPSSASKSSSMSKGTTNPSTSSSHGVPVTQHRISTANIKRCCRSEKV